LISFNRFHVARALLANAFPHFSPPPSLAPLVEAGAMPSPLEIRAVAEVDSGTELGLIQVVAAVHSAHPDVWSSAEVSDFVAFHATAFVTLLESSGIDGDRASFLTLIGRPHTLRPKLDAAVVARLVDRPGSDREALLRIVGAGRADDVLPFLKSGQRIKRLGAVEWVSHHRPRAAAEPLRVAIGRETDVVVKASMLHALEALGENIEEFLTVEAVAADARKTMAKKGAKPKAISWLDFDALPSLAWADGSSVAPEIAHWFVVVAVKAKSGEPSPIVRRLFDNMDPESVHRFGSTLLDLWLAEDVRTFDEEGARAHANEAALHEHRQASAGYGHFVGLTLQQIADAMVLDASKRIVGSATSSRGILALVAAAGPNVSHRSMAYIRKHRGQRKPQIRALIEMLAWIDQPATVQAVMSIASGFPTRSIELEALRQAELLARRRGVTLEDLADGAVPDGGFDADGRKTLDFGQRTFTVHLDDNLSIRLVNDSSGASIRSLPAARTAEDADHVKGIKRGLTDLKKELKSTLAMQPGRLHTAMLVGRDWSVAEFRRYFVDHPVMLRVATRLTWRGVAGDVVATFRPLSDGSLIGADDSDVELDPAARISLAHEQVVGDAVSSQWLTHLVDYELAPLFAQFGRPSVGFDEGQRSIGDFVGFGHTDGTLRSAMQRHGWKMGSTDDTGIVCELVRALPGADVTGVIEVFGGMHPAYSDALPCFFEELYFVPSSDKEVSRANAMKLETVPPILVTEFYAEVQAMAQAGSGFEPDHQQKL